jgi:hypothetical protein
MDSGSPYLQQDGMLFGVVGNRLSTATIDIDAINGSIELSSSMARERLQSDGTTVNTYAFQSIGGTMAIAPASFDTITRLDLFMNSLSFPAGTYIRVEGWDA